MNSRVIPAGLLAVLITGYLAFVFGSTSLLPERVASHFGANGEANGWMSRSGYLWFVAGMGAGLPLFIIVLGFLSKFFPISMVNVPHKEFWLAPSRRETSQAYLFDRSLWLGCLMVGFFAAIHYMTVVANRSVPARLPSQVFFVVLGVFLVCIGLWTIGLYRRFRKPA